VTTQYPPGGTVVVSVGVGVVDGAVVVGTTGACDFFVVVCLVFVAGLVAVVVGAGAGAGVAGTTGAALVVCCVFVAGCELWWCLRGFAVAFAGWVAVVAVVVAAAGAAAACVEVVVCVDAELPHPARARSAAIAVRAVFLGCIVWSSSAVCGSR
jgi:hypothetical protein